MPGNLVGGSVKMIQCKCIQIIVATCRPAHTLACLQTFYICVKFINQAYVWNWCLGWLWNYSNVKLHNLHKHTSVKQTPKFTASSSSRPGNSRAGSRWFRRSGGVLGTCHLENRLSRFETAPPCHSTLSCTARPSLWSLWKSSHLREAKQVKNSSRDWEAWYYVTNKSSNVLCWIMDLAFVTCIWKTNLTITCKQAGSCTLDLLRFLSTFNRLRSACWFICLG